MGLTLLRIWQKNGIEIVDSVILNEMNGSIDHTKNNWIIPYNHVKE